MTTIYVKIRYGNIKVSAAVGGALILLDETQKGTRP
jgi:hypothetical protein